MHGKRKRYNEYSQHPLIRTPKGTKFVRITECSNYRMFELMNRSYKSFLSKEIKIWFELVKVRITGDRINGHWLYMYKCPLIRTFAKYKYGVPKYTLSTWVKNKESFYKLMKMVLTWKVKDFDHLSMKVWIKQPSSDFVQKGVNMYANFWCDYTSKSVGLCKEIRCEGLPSIWWVAKKMEREVKNIFTCFTARKMMFIRYENVHLLIYQETPNF